MNSLHKRKHEHIGRKYKRTQWWHNCPMAQDMSGHAIIMNIPKCLNQRRTHRTISFGFNLSLCMTVENPPPPSPRLPACLPPQPVPHRLSCPQPSLPASALPTRYCLLLSRAISCPDLNNFLLCHPHSSAPSQLKRCWSPFTPFEKETGKEEKGYRKLAGERVGTGTGRGGVVGGVGLGGVEAEAKGKVE